MKEHSRWNSKIIFLFAMMGVQLQFPAIIFQAFG